MAQDVRITLPVAKVLAAFLSDPTEDRYGLELMAEANLASGTLYPILTRLQKAGWIESHWEQIDPVAEGRPARRYYRLTGEGAARAEAVVASLPKVTPRSAGSPRPAFGGAGMTAAGTAW